jgi:Protein of unknown function (DUF4242)
MKIGRVFLLEAYLPRADAGGPAAAVARASRAAAQMRRQGTPVRLLYAFFLPEDELCFCLYEAGSVDAVARASLHAEVDFERIQPALPLP